MPYGSPSYTGPTASVLFFYTAERTVQLDASPGAAFAAPKDQADNNVSLLLDFTALLTDAAGQADLIASVNSVTAGAMTVSAYEVANDGTGVGVQVSGGLAVTTYPVTTTVTTLSGRVIRRSAALTVALL